MFEIKRLVWTDKSCRNFMTPLQTQQSLDLAFDDASAFDLNAEILQFTNLDDSIIIDPSQVYHRYHMH
jgi:aldehyde dehydrogenase (NAD+)